MHNWHPWIGSGGANGMILSPDLVLFKHLVSEFLILRYIDILVISTKIMSNVSRFNKSWRYFEGKTP
jgi:hypothetical protein